MSNRRKLNLAKLARTMARQLAEDAANADREQYEVRSAVVQEPWYQAEDADREQCELPPYLADQDDGYDDSYRPDETGDDDYSG